MWIFLRLFPLMVGHLVSKTDKKWILLTDFLQIVELLCAKEFDDIQLSVLEGLLDTFFSDFSKQFPDNAIRFSILCRMSGLLWHGSKRTRRFGCFLQYMPGLEVLACSFDTDFNYVTRMLQLCLSLNHFVKTCKEMMDFGTSFSDLFSGTYINPRGALSWTRDSLLNFSGKCINFEIPN